MHMFVCDRGRGKETRSVSLQHFSFLLFSLSLFLIFLSSIPLDKASAKKGADKDNSTANHRHLAHVAHDKRRGSTAGLSGVGSVAAGARGSGVGSDGGDTAGTGLSSGGRSATGVLGTSTLKTGALAGTVLHELVGAVGDGGQLVVLECGHVPGVAVGGARAGAAVGLVVTVAFGGGVVLELGHECLEVLVLGHGVAGNLDEAVVGVLLGVLVDETAGVDGAHVGVVEGLDGFEGTLVLVATVLGKAVAKSVGGHGIIFESVLAYKRGRL
jgi:hypothetical protein